MERLRDVALDEFGRVHLWVNDVGRGITRSVLDLTDGEVDETMTRQPRGVIPTGAVTPAR